MSPRRPRFAAAAFAAPWLRPLVPGLRRARPPRAPGRAPVARSLRSWLRSARPSPFARPPARLGAGLRFASACLGARWRPAARPARFPLVCGCTPHVDQEDRNRAPSARGSPRRRATPAGLRRLGRHSIAWRSRDTACLASAAPSASLCVSTRHCVSRRDTVRLFPPCAGVAGLPLALVALCSRRAPTVVAPVFQALYLVHQANTSSGRCAAVRESGGACAPPRRGFLASILQNTCHVLIIK